MPFYVDRQFCVSRCSAQCIQRKSGVAEELGDASEMIVIGCVLHRTSLQQISFEKCSFFSTTQPMRASFTRRSLAVVTCYERCASMTGSTTCAARVRTSPEEIPTSLF